MGLVCSLRNILIGGIVIVLALIWLFVTNASTTVLFIVLIPAVLAVAFLALWALTTATGLTGYGKLFVLVYVISLGSIEAAAWWTLCYADTGTQKVEISEHGGKS